MTPWQEFYHSVKDDGWPDCEHEEDFPKLPSWIQKECQDIHGYKIGQYKTQPIFVQKKFPIKTETACQLKWNWSTVFLTLGKTASCHRTNHHKFDTDVFDFHNTPEKIDDRQRMLQGHWPKQGCDYCRDIEKVGGQSDRITNLDLPGMFPPPELDHNPSAVNVTPRILEIYFDNVCNLKCVYCGPHFSSLWDQENKKNGVFQKNGLVISDRFTKDSNIAVNKVRLFQWLDQHRQELSNFNFLGGEPLYQKDLDDCLDYFSEKAAPNLEFQIFTNLNAKSERLMLVIERVKDLIDRKHLRSFTVTASLDCWGEEQEYARFPLKLSTWEQNFQSLVDQPWIKLVVGSTLTPLTIKTFPELVTRINQWRMQRPIYHYVNSVNDPSYMFIDILGDIFRDDFQRAEQVIPSDDQDQISVKNYLKGIGAQSCSRAPNPVETLKLRTFLDEMDRRRDTDWRHTFKWLPAVFESILKDR